MEHEEIRDLCCCEEVVSKLNELFDGDEVGLNLNLTGWVSTERDWHQDYYLNVPGVGSHYVAAWMALDNISPDSGPFEFAVGSHVLPPMTQKKIFTLLSPSDQANPNWPKITERMVAEACKQIIDERGYRVEQFLANRGDMLVWHSRLLHRGSPPIVPGTERKSLISHYSVVSRRCKIDMPRYDRHKNQGLYFIL
jgi:ectoine hydroxylase-related dioxygenase (phytanoyl-CoA dioxygenase family)